MSKKRKHQPKKPRITGMPEGRPTKYCPEILDLTTKYIDACHDSIEIIKSGRTRTKQKVVNLPSIAGLSCFLNIHKDTINSWKKEHAEFSVLVGLLMSKQERVLLSKGLSGEYNSTITKLVLHKHGYRDAIDTDMTSGGKPMKEELDYSKLSDDVLRAINNAVTSKPE